MDLFNLKSKIVLILRNNCVVWVISQSIQPLQCWMEANLRQIPQTQSRSLHQSTFPIVIVELVYCNLGFKRESKWACNMAMSLSQLILSRQLFYLCPVSIWRAKNILLLGEQQIVFTASFYFVNKHYKNSWRKKLLKSGIWNKIIDICILDYILQQK